jgi:hypothetical protein
MKKKKYVSLTRRNKHQKKDTRLIHWRWKRSPNRRLPVRTTSVVTKLPLSVNLSTWTCVISVSYRAPFKIVKEWLGLTSLTSLTTYALMMPLWICVNLPVVTTWMRYVLLRDQDTALTVLRKSGLYSDLIHSPWVRFFKQPYRVIISDRRSFIKHWLTTHWMKSRSRLFKLNLTST